MCERVNVSIISICNIAFSADLHISSIGCLYDIDLCIINFAIVCSFHSIDFCGFNFV